MAFGIDRDELTQWKKRVENGEIAYLTHYWYDLRFPEFHTVTKVGCSDIHRLTEWCLMNGLQPKFIHRRQSYPHFDLIGPKQREILLQEQQWQQLKRFGMI